MKKLLIACFNIIVGITIGLGLLELILHANPALLLRGMGLPSPVDPPITTLKYDVRYSDADIFFWQSDQVKPISPEKDVVESHVTFETDEFGFPNPSPVPANVHVVVLGRSFSLGAQTSQPWPRILADKTGLNVLNLSQTGSSLDKKRNYLEHFGYPRKPRWVIMEVMTSMDIIGYTPGSNLFIPVLPKPLIRQLIRQNSKNNPSASQVRDIYPLPIEISGSLTDLTFYSYYLAALTVDKSSLEASNQWKAYEQDLLEIISQAKERSTCVLLLYIPTKSNIYFPLATNLDQLAPALQGWSPWRLNDNGDLIQSSELKPDVHSIQANASAGRDLINEFAKEHKIIFVDPTDLMMQAARSANSPFMVYDTHWSAIGNQLVAGLIADSLRITDCP